MIGSNIAEPPSAMGADAYCIARAPWRRRTVSKRPFLSKL
jgi:hypothetical protein